MTRTKVRNSSLSFGGGAGNGQTFPPTGPPSGITGKGGSGIVLIAYPST